MQTAQVKRNIITTLGGVLAGVPALIKGAGLACVAGSVGFCIPDSYLIFMGGLGVLIIGLGAKDGNVTGGNKPNVK